MNRPKLVALICVIVCFTGCAVAHKALRADYTTYNQTISYNQSQQMLLNLVRLKYRESPLFLKVGALSASYTYEVGGGISFLNSSGGKNTYGANLGTDFSTRPTITYTPLEGFTFVKQVLVEVAPETFALLLRSGWPIRTLSHVMLEAIGDDINNEDEPSYARFTALVEALQEGQKKDKIDFVTRQDKVYLSLRTFREDVYSDRQAVVEREVLIPAEHFHFRSFLDIMFFLGKNTEVPEAHADYVKQQEPNGWIRIRSSSSPLDDSMVSVQHHGYHFSIASSDLESKDVFALLKLLFQIQAGDITTVQPILTLPVAAP